MIERTLRGLDLADLHIMAYGRRLVARFAEPTDNGREGNPALEDVRILRVSQQSDEPEPRFVVVKCVLRLLTEGDLPRSPGLGLQHRLGSAERRRVDEHPAAP